jgi:antitoxin (DNA-binding transcriptional repressor) of toxin-antitoxin stability system
MEVEMDASISDLRYKMKNVLKALKMREKVRILYHGKVQGEIVPIKSQNNQKVEEHPLFGMQKNQEDHPDEIVSKLRRRRQNAF